VQHRNVVRLAKLLRVGGGAATAPEHAVLLVFELLESDLFQSLEAMQLRAVPVTVGHVRWLGRELLSGLAALHGQGVIHRDIKPENIMLASARGPLGEDCAKLVDFGQAKDVRLARGSKKDWTSYVATRWYRAPELLFGAARYTPAVDVWACGCVLGEMLAGHPIFPGDSASGQLHKLASTLGPPQRSWPECVAISSASGVVLPPAGGTVGPGVAGLLPAGTPAAFVDLLSSMLQWDPSKRPTASQALLHPFFSSGECVPVPPGRPPTRLVDPASAQRSIDEAVAAQKRLSCLIAEPSKGGAVSAAAPSVQADDEDDDFDTMGSAPVAASKPGSSARGIRRSGLGLTDFAGSTQAGALSAPPTPAGSTSSLASILGLPPADGGLPRKPSTDEEGVSAVVSGGVEAATSMSSTTAAASVAAAKDASVAAVKDASVAAVKDASKPSGRAAYGGSKTLASIFGDL
jgi:male germ cell-associated kinase